LKNSNTPSVNLIWTTANEINTSYFEIERSLDGKTFQPIGTVQAKNTAVQNNYLFADANIVSGILYYKLKMIDKDGAFKYSAIVVVNNANQNGLSVLPNPSSASVVTVTHNKATTNAQLKLVTMDGK